MKCRTCGATGLRFGQTCASCGDVYEHRCGYCGFENQLTARFCSGCGRPVTVPAATGEGLLAYVQSHVPRHLMSRMLRSANSMLGERKHVTVLFADIRGSTSLIERLDPEQALELIAPAIKVMMDAVHENGGFVNQTRGDGIKALFGAPLALEDHAARACSAALAMRDGIQAIADKGLANVAIRVGLNSGEVVIHSIGSDLAMHYDAAGRTTHLAARMEQIAPPGTVLLTAATYELAKGFIEATPRQAATVKGISGTVETFELTGMPMRTRWQVRSARGLTALFGREAELRVLKGALANAATGKGQAVLLAGSPGLGKSRLAHDFIRFLPRDWEVLETACTLQHMNSSYYPLSTLLRGLFKVEAGDGSDLIVRRAEEAIGNLSPALMKYVPAILSVLDLGSDAPEWKKLDPSERRHQVLEAVTALVLDWQRSAPLLILIEDIHWIDAETKLILDSIVGILHDARILLIATQRPEGAAWTAAGASQLIDLSPLDDQVSGHFVDWLMGDDVGLTPVKRRILAQAQGNPLFIEELVQALKDTKVLRGRRGHYHLGQSPERIKLPETIHSVLAARIDLLDGLPKALIQTAAVIGRDVPVALLSAMVGLGTDELAPQLEVLEAADFLYKTGLDPASAYSFKHELTREVAYGTLLLSMRRTLHAKAIEIIERSAGSRLDEHIDRLADHAYHAELWDRAVPYLLRSGRRAVKRAANRDAVKILERGIETVSHLPAKDAKTETEIDLRLALIIPLEPLGQHRRIAEVLIDARKFTDAAKDPRRASAVHCQLAVALWRLGEHDDALAAANAGLAIADRIGDQQLLFAALHNTGLVHRETGDFAKSVELYRRCLAMETPELDARRVGWAALSGVVLRTFLADSLAELGHFDEANAIAEEGGRRADASNHAYSQIMINHVRGRIRVLQDRPAEAVTLLRDSWQTCLKFEMMQQYPIMAARLGEAYLALGDREASHDILAAPEKLAVPLAQNTFGWGQLFLAQGRTYLAMGQSANALAVADRALRLAEQRGERPQQAYVLKLLGDISLAAGDRGGAVAERYLQRALEIASACGMKPLAGQCRDALASVAQWSERA